MLLVNAQSRPSPIDRIGLFAAERIPAGTKIWEFRSGFDVALLEGEISNLSPVSRQQVLRHAFFDVETQRYILSSDDDRFLNHSACPNVTHQGLAAFTMRDILPGEELVTNYAEWGSASVPEMMMPEVANDTVPRQWLINGHTGIRISRSELGWGLYANQDFSIDEHILTFSGPVLNHQETLALGRWSFYAVQTDQDRYIDVDLPGALLNHSCSPNAGIRDNIKLVAIKPIKAGDQILMDYSTNMDEGCETMQCACGSPMCRGTIGDFRDLPEALRNRYLSLGIVSDFIAAEYSASRKNTEKTKYLSNTHEKTGPRVATGTIPGFPSFAPLSSAQRSEFHEFVRRFPSYADFSWASLWSFDDGLPAICQLRGNLVLRLTDPANGERYCTFLGNDQVDETVDEILAHEKTLPESQHSMLRAIPHEAAQGSALHTWKEQRDSFEYVYDVTTWPESKDHGVVRRRHHAERFSLRYPNAVFKRLNLADRVTCNRMEALAASVMQQKGMLDQGLLSEQRALVRCLASAPALGCMAYGVEVADTLAGFMLIEPVHDGWYHGHFTKSDRQTSGLMEFLTLGTAHEMRKLGYRYHNDHEDLGLPGLRKVKESWQPVRLLKRYEYTGPHLV